MYFFCISCLLSCSMCPFSFNKYIKTPVWICFSIERRRVRSPQFSFSVNILYHCCVDGWARGVCVYLSFYQIFILTVLTFFPFPPFWRNIFSRSVIWVFSSTYLEERKGLVCGWQRHRIQIQIQQYLCQYWARAVKVFILECGETKQDRRGRGPRSIPDRYS